MSYFWRIPRVFFAWGHIIPASWSFSVRMENVKVYENLCWPLFNWLCLAALCKWQHNWQVLQPKQLLISVSLNMNNEISAEIARKYILWPQVDFLLLSFGLLFHVKWAHIKYDYHSAVRSRVANLFRISGSTHHIYRCSYWDAQAPYLPQKFRANNYMKFGTWECLNWSKILKSGVIRVVNLISTWHRIATHMMYFFYK